MTFAPIAQRGLILLGCGKMGSALLDGWLRGGLPASAATVIEPNPSDRLKALADEGLRLNLELPPDPAIAVLAPLPRRQDRGIRGEPE
ncbi:hypothetical protein CNY89_08145 [Amaricoccus sp. HAR-UPW-R2A-40]|nr:hypothetical protein CNY89_08145 [Amaricoccus sp. HAR-UPW-R2A-40]